MTNKTTMPEPICYANVVDIESYKESPRVNRRIPGAYDVPLYTKDQAEAYADARVREALEEAAKTVMDAPITAGMLDDGGAKALAIHANSRIRALIPKENKS